MITFTDEKFDNYGYTASGFAQMFTPQGIFKGPCRLCIVEPEAPWDNLIAITEAVNEFEVKSLNPNR